MILTPDEKLHRAIGKWMEKLNSVPGWEAWKRKGLVKALWFDDSWMEENNEPAEFNFPDDISLEHEVIMSYLGLCGNLNDLRDCEYYFRRFPFNGLPVSKHDHIRHVCEMYFGKFYEFKSRIKNCAKSVNKKIGGGGKLNFGHLIKSFENEFRDEITIRNYINHHERFEDIAIDNLMILEMCAPNKMMRKNFESRIASAYRRVSREWSDRVKRRSAALEKYQHAIAQAILDHCPFLSKYLETIALSDETVH